ncbi:MAG: hypothetical protein ACM3JD_00200, partial [Rudaea sp.]
MIADGAALIACPICKGRSDEAVGRTQYGKGADTRRGRGLQAGSRTFGPIRGTIMKSAVSALRNLVLPSVGFELKSRTAYLAELTRRARFWQWELAAFPHRDGTGPDVLYLGRKMERAQAMALLGIDGDIAAQPGRRAASRSVVVSEMWVPGALRVPALLSMVVPLGRALDEIAAGYDAGLRKLIRRRQADYRIRRVDEADIDRVERDMLKPFAAARHGARALRLDPGDVRKIALADWGRFDLVYAGEEAVGCQLSYRFVRAGKRYWRLFYCGYPQAIFADGRRL